MRICVHVWTRTRIMAKMWFYVYAKLSLTKVIQLSIAINDKPNIWLISLIHIHLRSTNKEFLFTNVLFLKKKEPHFEEL